MNKSKKRRMSILKKQNDFEESSPTETLTFKNKRRISFSGKKSVKEFCAGENAETIWGTSYEESANLSSSKQDLPVYNSFFKNDTFEAFQSRHALHDKEHWVYKQNNFIAQQNFASNEKENEDVRLKFDINSTQTANTWPKFQIDAALANTTIEDLSVKETKKRLNCTINRSEQNILKVCQDLDEGSSITLNGSELNIVKNLREKLKSPKKSLKSFVQFDENSHFNNTDINMSIDRMNTTEGFLKIEMMIENSQRQKSITLIDNVAIDKKEEEREVLNKLRTDTIISEELLDISSKNFFLKSKEVETCIENLDISSKNSELKSKEVETCVENVDMSVVNLKPNLQQNRKTILLDEKLDILPKNNILDKNSKSHRNRRTVIDNETIEPEVLQSSITKSKHETSDHKNLFSGTCNNMIIDNLDKENEGNNFENSDVNHKTLLSKNDDMEETPLKLNSMKQSFAVNCIDNLSSNFKGEESNATDNFNDLEDTQAMLNQLDHPSRYFESRSLTKSIIDNEKESKPLSSNDIIVFDALDMSIDYEFKNCNKPKEETRKENEVISNVFELSIEESNENNKKESRNTVYEAINFSFENSAHNIVPNDQIRKKNDKRKTITYSVDMSLDEDITKSLLSSSNLVQRPLSENTVRYSKIEEKLNNSIDKNANEKLTEDSYKSQDNNISNISNESFIKAQEKLKEISLKVSDLRKHALKSFQESAFNNMDNTNMITEGDDMDIVKEENEINQSMQEEVDVKTNDSVEITTTNLGEDFKESFDFTRCTHKNIESQNIENEINVFKKPVSYNNDISEKIEHSISTTKLVNSVLVSDSKYEKLPFLEDNYAKNCTEKRQTINFQKEQTQNDMEISLINDLSEPLITGKFQAKLKKSQVNISNQKENSTFDQKSLIDEIEEQTAEICPNSVINHLSVKFGNNLSINNSSRMSAEENSFSKRFESNELSCQQISQSVRVSKTIKPMEELNFSQDKNTEDKFDTTVFKSLKNIHKNTPPEAPFSKRSNTIYINDKLETEESDKKLQVFRNTRKSIIFENNDIEDEKATEIKNEIEEECFIGIADIKNNIGTLKNTRKTIIFENDNILENKSKNFELKSINRQTTLNPKTFRDLELTGINALDDSTSADLHSQLKIAINNEFDSINKMDIEIYNQKSDKDDIKHEKSIDDKIMELSKSILNYQDNILDLDSSDEELSLGDKNCNLSYLCNLPTPIINKNINEIPKINIINTSMEISPTKSLTLVRKSPKKEVLCSSDLYKRNSPKKETLLRNSPINICEASTNFIDKVNLIDTSNSFCRTLNFDEVPKKENSTGFYGSKSFFNISDSCNDEIEKTKMILVDSSESLMNISKIKDKNEKHISKVPRYRRSSLNKKLCSKCKRCRLSMDKTEIDNFKLEPEFIEEVDFSVLDKYKNYTTLQDVWIAHERRQVNTYDLDLSNVNFEKNCMNSDINLGKYFKNFQIENCFPIGNKFEIELKDKISNINNTWKLKVCSYYSSNFIILRYNPCPAIELVIECTPINFQNFDSKFNKIYTRQSCIYAEESWSPNDKLIFMEFKKLIPSNEKLYHKCSKLKELNLFLKFFDEIIQEIIINVKKLMSVIINARASLERYGDKVAVNKIYYDKSSNKKTILIEINRIKEISIKNIISPHISQFSTTAIRGFPTGVKFVEIILNDLNSYMIS